MKFQMKILGIDYGQSKIGVAVGDTKTGLTEPLVTIRSKKQACLPARFTARRARQVFSIKQIATREKVEKIVVGVPGGRMDEEIKNFGEELTKQTGLSVEYVDETLTTHDAQRELIASGRKQKNRRKKEDAIAAAIMLEYFVKGESGNV